MLAASTLIRPNCRHLHTGQLVSISPINSECHRRDSLLSRFNERRQSELHYSAARRTTKILLELDQVALRTLTSLSTNLGLSLMTIVVVDELEVEGRSRISCAIWNNAI